MSIISKFWNFIIMAFTSTKCTTRIGYWIYAKSYIGYLLHRHQLRNYKEKHGDAVHSITLPFRLDPTQPSLSIYKMLDKTLPPQTKGISVHIVCVGSNNYTYLVEDVQTRDCVIIDPGDDKPIMDRINELKIKPLAIMVTHKHWDHCAGNKYFAKQFPGIKIYSGQKGLQGTTNVLSDGDLVTVGSIKFQCMHTPFHTMEHYCFYVNCATSQVPGCIFTGDALFLGGIGNIFEGDEDMVTETLQKIISLPDSTFIFPGHEFSINNMKVVADTYTQDLAIQATFAHIVKLRRNKICTIPSTIAEEKLHNPHVMRLPSVVAAMLDALNSASFNNALM